MTLMLELTKIWLQKSAWCF